MWEINQIHGSTYEEHQRIIGKKKKVQVESLPEDLSGMVGSMDPEGDDESVEL